MKRLIALALCLLPAGAAAQVSDIELMQMRADSAEATARYLSALLQREQQNAKALREWWASYVEGLKQ